MNKRIEKTCGKSPNDLSSATAEGGAPGAAEGLREAPGVTPVAVRCSAGLGDVGLLFGCIASRCLAVVESATRTLPMSPSVRLVKRCLHGRIAEKASRAVIESSALVAVRPREGIRLVATKDVQWAVREVEVCHPC